MGQTKMNREILYVAVLAMVVASWRVYSETAPQPDGPVYAEVIFKRDDATIPEEARASLTNLARTLRMWPGSASRIEGHAATSEGLGAIRLMEISEKRANAVHDFLRTVCGVTNILEVVGYSDSRPKTQRGTPDEAMNARVEVYIRAPIQRTEGPE